MSENQSYTVQIELDNNDMPRRIRYLGQWHRILSCRPFEEVIEQWYGRTEVKIHYLCITYRGLECVLFKDGENWTMEIVPETRQIK
ncbi:MAG: hypothetical protein A4E56_02242 [Pelotomaculum sp. PtaU1.Bin065]|nr:MAG: hypothetical protein A4E56_02242 [Pelotomaculum sp. PtaU1.Bin065]